MSDHVVIEGLRELAERGVPRGADALYRAANGPAEFVPGQEQRAASRPGRVRWQLVAAATVVVLVVAGIAAVGRSRTARVELGATTTTGSVDVRAQLLGRRFVATSITEHGQPKQLLRVQPVELAFDADLELPAGCNTTWAHWRIEGDRLVTSPGDHGATAMGCRDDVLRENWVGKFLAAGPRVVIDGPTLRLIGADAEIVLRETKTFVPTQPVEGTRWALTRANRIVQPTPGVELPAPADGARPFLELRDGTATVATGCITVSVPYTITPERGEFVELRTTQLITDDPGDCPADRRAVHDAIIDVLNERAFPQMPDGRAGSMMLRNNNYVLYFVSPAIAPDPAG